MTRQLHLSRELIHEKGRCRWCGSPVPKGRKSWCSDQCVKEFRIEAWPSEARQAVFERDHGICATCQRDCEAVQARIEKLAKEALRYDREEVGFEAGPTRLDRWRCWKRIQGWLNRLGLAHEGGFNIHSLWHHHHIIPVCQGGMTVLSNLQTLCVCCHKTESRQLAARRALQRRVNP